MIEFSTDDKKLICKFTEQIVASKIQELRSVLASYLDYNQHWSTLVFDCQHVKTLDSIGVNFIIGAFKKASSSERGFEVIGCNETVFKVLRLFRLEEKFPVLAIG